MRYHRDFGFPPTLVIPEIVLYLEYTAHAKERIKRKNARIVHKIPVSLKLLKKGILEVYTRDNIKADRIVYRGSYTEFKDIILVFEPNFKNKSAALITFWLCHKNDNHTNLKQENYNKWNNNNQLQSNSSN